MATPILSTFKKLCVKKAATEPIFTNMNQSTVKKKDKRTGKDKSQLF